MLRLSIYCTLVSSPRHEIKIGKGYGSMFTYQRCRILQGRIAVRGLKDEMDGGKGGGASGQSWDPGLEIEVPFEQRPDPLRFFLAAGTGTLFLVSLIVLRIYLGWSYVGDRLLSAVIPYEETGWYDGQMWVKPPEILARDRLLGSYKVKPVIKLLKQTLVGTGVMLVTAVSLFIFATPVEDFIHKTFVQENQSNGSVSKISSRFNLRKEELLRLPVDVKTDDDLAAAAAEAAGGRPVYCRDRFYRVLAGGQYCKWEDLLK